MDDLKKDENEGAEGDPKPYYFLPLTTNVAITKQSRTYERMHEDKGSPDDLDACIFSKLAKIAPALPTSPDTSQDGFVDEAEEKTLSTTGAVAGGHNVAIASAVREADIHSQEQNIMTPGKSSGTATWETYGDTHQAMSQATANRFLPSEAPPVVGARRAEGELAVALEITPDEEERERPVAVEYDKVAERAEARRRRRCGICIAFACFAAIVIVAVVTPVMVLRKIDDRPDLSEGVRTVTEPPGHTLPPTPIPTNPELIDQIKKLVGDKINENGTAHKRAFEWLTKEDSAHLDKDSPNLAQRYILSLLAFSTDTYNWKNCGAVKGVSSPSCSATFYDYWEEEDVVNGSYSRWLSSDPECKWFGIRCHLGDNVNDLYLADNNLNGYVISELSLLPNLQSIALFKNFLSGTIPSELGEMKALNSLELQINELSGSIPEEMYNATGVQLLSLGENVNLSGTISTRIGKLTRLAGLFLQETSLTGTIPTEVGKLEVLGNAWFSRNPQLGGTIPTEFAKLRFLEVLYLHKSNFTGTLPSQFGSMTSLMDLDVSRNSLSGTIPDALYNASSLNYLFASFNNISGTISPLIGNLLSLVLLDISGNQISGSLPEEFYGLTSLNNLDCSFNFLTGSIPPLIEKLVNLTSLIANDNNFEGPIPSEIGTLTYLQDLDIHSNRFNGPLPDGFYTLISLKSFDASHNFLSGTISSLIQELEDLEVFRVQGNLFTGTIPTKLAMLQNISEIQVQFNNFTGNMSDAFCDFFDGSRMPRVLYADCGPSNFTGPPAVECDCCTDCCDKIQEICMSMYQ